jgi:hypothetical protein
VTEGQANQNLFREVLDNSP